jgi:phage shock protein PspC (stress-responsive transcriptional regulator)
MASFSLPFYRKPSSGWLLGVCAGIGEIAGVRPWMLRVSILLAAYFFPFYVLLGYAMLGLLFQAKRILGGGSAFEDDEDALESVDLTVPYSVHAQYRELESRLASLEEDVLSKETDLRRRFREAGL